MCPIWYAAITAECSCYAPNGVKRLSMHEDTCEYKVKWLEVFDSYPDLDTHYYYQDMYFEMMGDNSDTSS